MERLEEWYGRFGIIRLAAHHILSSGVNGKRDRGILLTVRILVVGLVSTLPLLNETVYAQTHRYPVSALAIPGIAYSAKLNGPFSAITNPASLSRGKTMAFGIYVENKYGANGLGYLAVSGKVPVGNAGLGVNISHFGNSLYNEMNAGVAYGRSLGQVEIGILFNYQLYKIQGLPSEGYINYGLGARFHLTDQVTAGVFILNTPFFVKPADNSPAPVYRLGLGYDVSENVYLGMEWKNEPGRQLQLFPIARYQVADKYKLRAGLATASDEFFVGVGWTSSQFTIEVVLTVHSELGGSPGATFIILPRKNSGE